jgi:transposase
MSGKYGKGPGLFWEKAWKTINTQTYCEHIFPVVWNYLYGSPYRMELKFQQDGGAGHNAKATLAYMADRGVIPIFHCPFSPDLSPIEALWDRMKDILAALHPEVHRSSPRLRAAVKEAWDLITEIEVRDLVHTMHQRCLDVIEAHGAYTKW